jgi:hypothetical protein
VPLVPLGLRHREDDEQPAVGLLGPAAAEDARIPVGQDLLRDLGERVARHAVHPPGIEEPPALEPGDRRPDGGLLDPQRGHQPDDGGDRQPAAALAGVEAVQAHDELPRLQPSGLPGCLLDDGHRDTITTAEPPEPSHRALLTLVSDGRY